MQYKLDKIEALYHINESFLTILDINELLNKVLEILKNTFGFDTAAILLYDETSGELYIRAATGYAHDVIKNFRTTIGGKGLTGHVAQTMQPIYIPNIEEETRYIPGVKDAKAEIAIPLLVENNRLLGVLDIESRHEYVFTEDDFEAICLFSSHLAQALRNAILFESERKKNSQLMIINQIRERISADLELEHLLRIVAQSIVEFFSYYQVVIYIWHEGQQTLKLMAHAGFKDIVLQPNFINPVDHPSINKAFHEGKTILMSNLTRTDALLFDQIQSEMAIPISMNNGTAGVIYIACLSPEAFDQKDIHILEVIGEQLSLIIREIIDLSKIIKRSKHMDIVHKIGKVTIKTFNLRKYFSDIAKLIHDIFGYFHVGIFIYEKVSEELELAAFDGEPMKDIHTGDRITVRDGIAGYVIRSGQYYLCNDTTKDAIYLENLVNTKSELSIPIQFENQILGVINIESTKLNQFEETDVDIFMKIAEQVACTLVNAELYKRKTSAHNLLLNLNRLGREINATFDLNKIVSLVIKQLPGYVDCRLSSLFFYYPETHQLMLMAHNLPDLQEGSAVSFSANRNVLMNRVISLKRSIYVTDIEKELQIPKNPRYETKSFMNILLQHHDRIIGILNLTDKLNQDPFTSEEFYLIHSFGEHLSNAIINSEKYQTILQLSITDGLTGLYVHRHFQESLEKEISRAIRHNLPLSLIMMDFDKFKQFNDTYGHQIGDIILREIAVLIRKEIREYDIACRYGGEEFGIILPSTSLLQARNLANRLREKIEEHSIDMGCSKISITVSQGVCEYDPETDKDMFVRQTDTALFRAKKEGRNRVISCTEIE